MNGPSLPAGVRPPRPSTNPSQASLTNVQLATETGPPPEDSEDEDPWNDGGCTPVPSSDDGEDEDDDDENTTSMFAPKARFFSRDAQLARDLDLSRRYDPAKYVETPFDRAKEVARRQQKINAAQEEKVPAQQERSPWYIVNGGSGVAAPAPPFTPTITTTGSALPSGTVASSNQQVDSEPDAIPPGYIMENGQLRKRGKVVNNTGLIDLYPGSYNKPQAKKPVEKEDDQYQAPKNGKGRKKAAAKGPKVGAEKPTRVQQSGWADHSGKAIPRGPKATVQPKSVIDLIQSASAGVGAEGKQKGKGKKQGKGKAKAPAKSKAQTARKKGKAAAAEEEGTGSIQLSSITAAAMADPDNAIVNGFKRQLDRQRKSPISIHPMAISRARSVSSDSDKLAPTSALFNGTADRAKEMNGKRKADREVRRHRSQSKAPESGEGVIDLAALSDSEEEETGEDLRAHRPSHAEAHHRKIELEKQTRAPPAVQLHELSHAVTQPNKKLTQLSSAKNVTDAIVLRRAQQNLIPGWQAQIHEPDRGHSQSARVSQPNGTAPSLRHSGRTQTTDLLDTPPDVSFDSHLSTITHLSTFDADAPQAYNTSSSQLAYSSPLGRRDLGDFAYIDHSAAPTPKYHLDHGPRRVANLEDMAVLHNGGYRPPAKQSMYLVSEGSDDDLPGLGVSSSRHPSHVQKLPVPAGLSQSYLQANDIYHNRPKVKGTHWRSRIREREEDGDEIKSQNGSSTWSTIHDNKRPRHNGAQPQPIQRSGNFRLPMSVLAPQANETPAVKTATSSSSKPSLFCPSAAQPSSSKQWHLKTNKGERQYAPSGEESPDAGGPVFKVPSRLMPSHSSHATSNGYSHPAHRPLQDDSWQDAWRKQPNAQAGPSRLASRFNYDSEGTLSASEQGYTGQGTAFGYW